MLFKELINNEVVDLTNEIIDINIIGWPNIWIVKGGLLILIWDRR